MTETDTKSDTDDRKRKLALALAILESSESNDSTDDEILQMLIKERVLRPKHKKRQSLMESYAEEDVLLDRLSIFVHIFFTTNLSLVSKGISHETRNLF